ncbi:MAG TPA: Spy/CpxP family protein refolding chaperone [Burkholderiales bacterium]|nr:Spy/CpxP family protein refolding chaperone [Burkholderiales bacterium]
MKVSRAFVRNTMVAVVASLGLAAAMPQASAGDPYDNPGYGPGYGMGPGMMGGYGGYGPGMMGGYGGYGPGYGMGPGYGRGYGYGMGPGYGRGGGAGPEWGRGGCGGYGYGWENLKLTDEQRTKIDKILEDAARQRWELMGKMREQGWKMHELYASGKADDAALKQAYDTMSAMRKSMFENNLETRKKIDAVLTKEQREQLRRGPNW